MLTYLVAFGLAFVVAAGLTPILRAAAPFIGGVDQGKSSRKVHKAPTPRIGGVAIVAAFFVPLTGMFLIQNDTSALFWRDTSRTAGIYVGGLAIALLGFYDDLRGANARVKFAVQFAVAGLMFALGYRIDVIANPFGSPLALGWLGLPLTLVWIVGVINAMNLIDGLDGLAGGVATIAVGLIFAVAFNQPNALLCLFMSALGGALLGFLLYNFNPATIFMGDTGSMFLGFVLAVTSISSASKSSTAVAILVPIVGLGLPIADTLLAMLRRALRGRPIFSADREHIHHKLLALGLTHRQAVLVLYGICLVLALAAFIISYANSAEVALTIVGLGLAAMAALHALGYLRVNAESARLNAQSRERNQALRATVRDIGHKLRDADRLDVVWDAVKYLGPAIDAERMTLSVVVKSAGTERQTNVLSWHADAPRPVVHAPCAVRLDLEARAPLPTGEEGLGHVEVEWLDGRREIQRDDEIALEMLVDHLEGALDRLRRIEPSPAPSNVIALRRRGDSE